MQFVKSVSDFSANVVPFLPSDATFEELAARLRITPQAARRAHSEGRLPIPSYRVGRRRLFPRVEVERFIRERMEGQK